MSTTKVHGWEHQGCIKGTSWVHEGYCKVHSGNIPTIARNKIERC
jgi:hypothetical protein